MDKKIFIGMYNNDSELMAKIDELKTQGIEGENIYVIAEDNTDVAMFQGMKYGDVQTAPESWFDRFMDILTGSDHVRTMLHEVGVSEGDMDNYYEQIQNGGKLLYVDKGEMNTLHIERGERFGMTNSGTDPNLGANRVTAYENEVYDDSLPAASLREEAPYTIGILDEIPHSVNSYDEPPKAAGMYEEIPREKNHFSKSPRASTEIEMQPSSEDIAPLAGFDGQSSPELDTFATLPINDQADTPAFSNHNEGTLNADVDRYVDENELTHTSGEMETEEPYIKNEDEMLYTATPEVNIQEKRMNESPRHSSKHEWPH
ncbi:general stress protein [Sporosarcina oncorhynchi]|uniref:General stress protein n=1 Tax=Sporosarcina oncorhynchi TaxID=3056444 RepID=A0ABZ0L6P4_9BACL|nr:general stress protein [Sporosarcina sp. T2O-4]WOV88237.1 general stress protein [Sporosarcina sp. T2O-4]